MDSAVSEASTHMVYFEQSLNSPAGAATALPSARRHPPVKRQASALSELTAQSADFLRQQQLGWVQLYPAAYQLQLQPQLASLATWDAGSGTYMQMLPAAAVMPAAASMQSLPHGSTAGPVPYSHAAAAGGLAGLDPAAAPGLAAAGSGFAAPAATAPSMQAPAHRLPKRRASAPHLLAAANSQPQIFRCVPHTGGPDCQCTSCLCARTDELCRRIVAQRSAQAAAAAAGCAPDAAAAAGTPVQGHAQPQPQSQPQQQQQDAGRGSLSPGHTKRRSMELPPVAKTRRSQDGRLSPGSSSSPPVRGSAMSVHQLHHSHAGAPGLNSSAAVPAAGMTRSSSTQLRGHFQQLTVSCSPFEDAPGVSAAAVMQQPQQQQLPYGGPTLGRMGQLGSAHSAPVGTEEEDVDRELELMLAQAGWPLDVAGCGAGPMPAPMQQQQQHMQPAGMPMQGMAGSQDPAAFVPLGAAAPAAHAGHGLLPQQQHPAGPAGAGGCAVPGGHASTQGHAVLEGLGDELRVPSFDCWGRPGAQQGPGLPAVPPLCPSELQMLDELLDTNPEEASLVDLLLN